MLRYSIRVGFFSLALVTLNSQAQFVDRGGGMVYDASADVTWATAIHGPSTWFDAGSWADGLAVGVFNDWRLPSLTELQSIAGSLIYEGPAPAPFNLFTPISFQGYWSSTEFALDASYAWSIRYDLETPYSWQERKSDNFLSAIAVRTGDVVSPIPEPQTYALLLSGLVLLVFEAQRRRKLRHATT